MQDAKALNNSLPADHFSGNGQLEAELEDARLLHRLSIELIQENGSQGLYKKIVEGAVAIMRSQYASMQMLFPEPGTDGKLRLLASSGFNDEAEKFWEWVYQDTGSSCGAALRAKTRVIIPNFATCVFMQDMPTLPIFLEAGIYAAQSTPLYSRNGKLLGMISTHWSYPHDPPERHLHLLDVLARQAADLIERTQTAEALRQSEQRMRALATATNDVIYRMSADWKEMYQLDGRNVIRDTGAPGINWMDQFIHPADQQAVTTAIRQAIETKQIFQMEHRVLKKDGSTGWTFSRAVPILDADGAILEWFGAATDVTDKVTLLLRLEEKVAQRTRDLQRSNDDLMQFAHVASHDLKEPVRKIRTYGLRLKEELNGHANEHCIHYNEKILESAGRMSAMIEGVLKYASLSALEQETETLDLNEILAEIQNDLELLVEHRNAVIQTESLPGIEGVRVLIYQLFYNLINNSLKFSRADRDTRITIKSAVVRIDEDDFAKIEVADNGIGFDAEHNEEIFNTFTRLNPKHRYDGTGLGLALARKIVERHHGVIEARGHRDQGAVFTILLPVKQRKSTMARATAG